MGQQTAAGDLLWANLIQPWNNVSCGFLNPNNWPSNGGVKDLPFSIAVMLSEIPEIHPSAFGKINPSLNSLRSEYRSYYYRIAQAKLIVNVKGFGIIWKDKPKVVEQAKKWSLEKTKKMREKTYNFEVYIKSNAIVNKNLLVKKLIIDICELANA